MNTLNQWAEEREDTAQRSFLLKEQRSARVGWRWGGQGRKVSQGDFSSFLATELQISSPQTIR